MKPEMVEKKLKENPEIKAVVLTSPTYEGVVSDIKGIKKTIQPYGIPLIVDEAHMFKNCMITTKLSNVAGLSTTSSNKSMDMLWKCKYLSEIQNGRGVVFATGKAVPRVCD